MCNLNVFSTGMSPGSDSDSSSSSTRKKAGGQSPPQPVVQLLSEAEMNALGAKIVKAEIMGNEVAVFIFMELKWISNYRHYTNVKF